MPCEADVPDLSAEAEQRGIGIQTSGDEVVDSVKPPQRYPRLAYPRKERDDLHEVQGNSGGKDHDAQLADRGQRLSFLSAHDSPNDRIQRDERRDPQDDVRPHEQLRIESQGDPDGARDREVVHAFGHEVNQQWSQGESDLVVELTGPPARKRLLRGHIQQPSHRRHPCAAVPLVREQISEHPGAE